MGRSYLPMDSRLAVRELIYSTILMAIGYYFTTSMIWLRVQRKDLLTMIAIDLQKKQLLIIGLVVLTSSFIGATLPGAVKQLHDLSYVMCLILLLSSDASGSKWLHQLLILGAFFNMSYTLVEHGSLVDFGHFAVILFVRSAVTRNMKGLTAVGCVVVMGLFIQPIKGAYRIQSRAGDFSFGEKAGMFTDLVAWRYFTEEGWASQKQLGLEGRAIEEGEDYQQDDQLREGEGGALSALSMGFTRVHDDSFERTLMMTPNRVPFWNGETYANMLYMFIPRLLWPEKPSWKHWHKFGKVYGYLAPNDNETSVSFSMFAEAYMNFGFTGLYIITFLFGVLLGVAERIAFGIFKGNYLFCYISLLTPLINYSADLGIMVNRLVIVVTALLIFRPFLVRNVIGDDYSR